MADLPKAAQGTFDELLADVEPKLSAIGDNAATYGVGQRKMTDGYAYIVPMRGCISLGFYQGAMLEDPERFAGRRRQGAASRENPLPGRC